MKNKAFKFTDSMNVGSLDAQHIRVGVVVATFNGDISNGLLDGCLQQLKHSNVNDENVYIYTVDGCVELPVIAQRLADKKVVDVVICLGAVIKGDTPHFDYVCKAVTEGVTRVSLDYKLPVIFGVLTTLTYDQALKRASNDENNKGAEVTRTAIKTLNLLNSI